MNETTVGNPESGIPRIEVIGVTGLPEVRPGARLGEAIAAACASQRTPLEDGDVLVVTQKIVSKAENMVVSLSTVEPSPFAERFAAECGRDPRLIELVLRENRAIVRMDPDRGILITETRHGFVCANAGIDASNVPGDDMVSLLPADPDESARRILGELREAAPGIEAAVVISDTFGRAWREGHVNFAIGVAGMEPFRDYRGSQDAVGKTLGVTRIAEVDEMAAAAELVMAKARSIPAAIVRGHRFTRGGGGSGELIRPRSSDLFR